MEVIKKIYFNKLQNLLHIKEKDAFEEYLNEIYYNISSGVDNFQMDKAAFNDISRLPIFISDKLFEVFCKSETSLSKEDFTKGILDLYCGSFTDVAKVIFNLFDFTKLGSISKSNIKMLLSFIPFLNIENIEYYDLQAKCQIEIESYLQEIFVSVKNFNFKAFLELISSDSDLFLIPLCYLYDNFPFKSHNYTKFTQIKVSPTKKKHKLSSIKLPTVISEDKILYPTNFFSLFKPSLFVKDLLGSLLENKLPLEKKFHSRSTSDVIRLIKKNSTLKFNHEVENEVQSFDIEGYIIETNDKIRKVYISLAGDEIFIFKNIFRNDLLKIIRLNTFYVIELSKVLEKKLFHGIALYSLNNPEMSIRLLCNKKEESLIMCSSIKAKIKQKSVIEYYEFLDLLGEGSFGQVKLALHKFTKERVAVKILKKKNINDMQKTLARNEIDIMKLCCHPNIVDLKDVIEDHEKIYIIMEYIPGIDLFTFLDEKSFLSENMIKRIMIFIVNTVKYLHTYGIVHRDLKLDNIMIFFEEDKQKKVLRKLTQKDKKGSNKTLDFTLTPYDTNSEFFIKITDFGISKVISNDTFLNDRIGTLRFCAPEILSNKPYNKQIDNWSLGVIMYLLYCGEYPFEDYDEETTLRKVLFEDLSFTNTLWSKASADFKDLISNCLNKDPSKRYNILKIQKHPFFK